MGTSSGIYLYTWFVVSCCAFFGFVEICGVTKEAAELIFGRAGWCVFYRGEE